MWSLGQATAKFFQGIGKLPTPQFQKERAQFLFQLSRIDTTYVSSHHYYARKADAGIKTALGVAAEAIDARGAGAMQNYYAKMKEAWVALNGIYPSLKTFCPLGHPARTQLDVSLDGSEYGDGIAPLPLSAPWLSLSQSWLIRWSYTCYRGTPNGFRIEVRAVQGNPALLMSDTSVYLGPLLTVAVDKRGARGSGVTRMRGIRGPAYLVERSRCSSSTKVLG